MREDRDRAVTATLSYVLTLSITMVLASGLLIAAGGLVEDRRDAAARDELSVVGERLASQLMAADRLVGTGATSVAVTAPLPETVAGSTYAVTVNESGSDLIVLHTTGQSLDVTVRVAYAASTPVAGSNVASGTVTVLLTGSGELEVRAA